MKIVSWNIGHRSDHWRHVATFDADIALLQEACEPPEELLHNGLDVDSEEWCTEGQVMRRWRASLVGLRSDLRLQRLTPRRLSEARESDFGVSRLGTIAAAHVELPSTSERLTLVSMYATWERPHPHAGGSWIFADAAAHRLISDISALVSRQRGHLIIAAGDLNCLYGHGEHGNAYWAARYQTIFDRMDALGFAFVGPQAPSGGRQADPWPAELPLNSLNVPTYFTSRQSPTTATRQLDFVFASKGLAHRLEVRAVNDPTEWGPSDHCRVEIRVRDT